MTLGVMPGAQLAPLLGPIPNLPPVQDRAWTLDDLPNGVQWFIDATNPATFTDLEPDNQINSLTDERSNVFSGLGATKPTYDAANGEIVYVNGSVLQAAVAEQGYDRHYFVVAETTDAAATIFGSSTPINTKLGYDGNHRATFTNFIGTGTNRIPMPEGGANPSIDSGAYRLLHWRAQSGGRPGFSIDGGTVEEITSNISTNATNIEFIGNVNGTATSGNDRFNGKIKIVLVVNGPLDEADRLRIEGYLFHTYGAFTIAPGHPYETEAPLFTIPFTLQSSTLASGPTFSLPFTDNFAHPDGATGLIITTMMVAEQEPTVTVAGVPARLVNRTFGDNVNVGTRYIQATYYADVLTNGSKTISVDIPEIEYPNKPLFVAVSAVGGNQIRSWTDAFVQLPSPPGSPDGITVPGVEYGVNDIIYGVLIGDQDASPPADMAALATIDELSGNMRAQTSSRITISSAASEDLFWDIQGSPQFLVASAVVFSSAEVDQLAIDDPTDSMVFARAFGTTSRDVSVSGYYTGADPSGIEMRVVDGDDDSEIVAWSQVDAAPANGVWSGAISVPQGANYRLQARRAGSTDADAIGRAVFGVGIWAVLYGQSNMVNFTNRSEGLIDAHTVGAFYDPGRDPNPQIPGDLGEPVRGIGFMRDANGGRALAKSLFERSGIPIGLINGAASGVEVAALDPDPPAQKHFAPLLEQMTAVGEQFELILWHQGEGNSGAPTIEDYSASLLKIHEGIAAHAGLTVAQMPLILAGLGTEQGTIGNDQGWSEIEDILTRLPSEMTNVHYSHVNIDTVNLDSVHWNGAGYTNAGNRYAHEIARLFGDEPESAVLSITASNPQSTTTDVVIDHGIGTDFTPTAGISGFEVSIDDFTTPVACTGARIDATTIRLTHASIATTGRKVRHMWGKNPDRTGLVTDNGALGMPLGRVLSIDVEPSTSQAISGSANASAQASGALDLSQSVSGAASASANAAGSVEVPAAGFDPDAAAFNPTWDIDPNDASTITESGGVVSAIASRIASAFSLEQTDAGNRPSVGVNTMNGRDVLTFNDQYMRFVGSPMDGMTGEWTFAFVYLCASNSNRYVMEIEDDDGIIIQTRRTPGDFRNVILSAPRTSLSASLGPVGVTLRFSGTTARFEIFGSHTYSNAVSRSESGLVNVQGAFGARSNFGNQFIGDIARAKAWNHYFDGTDYDDLKAYLTTTYGL
ncbi:MAG: sialate O-acetylesterase, partial [Pseudomonadota bacterium]